MSTSFTPGVTVTEAINEDGSKTVTTVTIHEDGSKSTKRKTIRPKKKAGVSPKNSPTNSPRINPPKATPKPSVERSMDDAFEEALAEEGVGHKDDAAFEKAVRRCIPSDFFLIASQDDLTQAQEDHYASKNFGLPNTIGDAGSVATSALLQYLYQNDRFVNGSSHKSKPLNCLDLVQEMHARMKKVAAGFVLHPQVCSSKPLGPPRLGSKQYAPFHIVPPGATGTKRALLIGIKFADDSPSKQLKGPHNDVHNVQHYLTTKCGFSADNITVLKDVKELPPNQIPTKKNIWTGFQKLVEESKPGDVVFIQYSGHGGRVKDTSGDEGDGYDSYILPSDYKTEGQILDDEILKDLIKAMPAGVHTTMLVDCCNSGTVGDLPYVLKANTQRDQEIEKFFDTDTRAEILEKEARGLREQEEYKRAKAERKKQRELQKMQQENDAAAAKAKATTDAENLAQQLVGLNTGSPSSPTRTMAAPSPLTTKNFEVTSEAEVEELSRKHGVAFQLSPDQKACLQRGGTVTLSIQLQAQQPQPMTMAPQMQQTGMVMMTPEQAEAFKKANGGNLVMTPEQAAMFMQQQQGV